MCLVLVARTCGAASGPSTGGAAGTCLQLTSWTALAGEAVSSRPHCRTRYRSPLAPHQIWPQRRATAGGHNGSWSPRHIAHPLPPYPRRIWSAGELNSRGSTNWASSAASRPPRPSHQPRASAAAPAAEPKQDYGGCFGDRRRQRTTPARPPDRTPRRAGCLTCGNGRGEWAGRNGRGEMGATDEMGGASHVGARHRIAFWMSHAVAGMQRRACRGRHAEVWDVRWRYVT